MCLIFIVCLLPSSLIPLTSQAQPDRARRFFNLSLMHEAKREHKEARKKMEDAIRLYPAYTEAYSKLAAWYAYDHNWDAAIATCRAASQQTPMGAQHFAYPLALSLNSGLQPAEALSVIATYGNNNKEWTALRSQAMLLQKELAYAGADTVVMLPRVNTKDPEMFPWLSGNGNELYFTRRVKGNDEDFFSAKPDSCGGWFSGVNLGAPPNTLAQESAQMISADGHYLFFSRCENRVDNGWEGGGCDLYMAYRADSIWSTPQNFGATINTPAFEGMPCLSADNRELYFASDRPGGYGGMDIWMSRFENGMWQVPRNLGPAVNTKGTETAPYLHIDNHTLFFSSTGHTTLGGSDIFRTTRTGDTTWAAAQHLSCPINTPAEETGICLSVDGSTAYFSSDRKGVSGDFDLFEVALPPSMQPLQVAKIEGYVRDSLSDSRLTYASIYITDAATGDAMYHFNSNRGDGSYMITLPVGKTYYWHTDRVAYQDREDTINIARGADSTHAQHIIAMLPQGYVAPVNDSLLLTIHFPLNSAKLTDSDKILIHAKLEPWLADAAGSVLFVNGYTDNTGTPIINEQLSYSRANLVTAALVDLGIEPLNIKTQGWGEAQPLAPNDTDEGMSLNRRVEVIIRR